LIVLAPGESPQGYRLRPPTSNESFALSPHMYMPEVHAGAPILSAEPPEAGERFEGVLLPVVRASAFAIHKRTAITSALPRWHDQFQSASVDCPCKGSCLERPTNTKWRGGMSSELQVVSTRKHCRPQTPAERCVVNRTDRVRKPAELRCASKLDFPPVRVGLRRCEATTRAPLVNASLAV
jgi:hypothetical protein